MSPPAQTPHSRKRIYFSLFYSVVHVVNFMSPTIYWTILVPKGRGHFPKEEELSVSSGQYLPHLLCCLQVFC